MRSLLLIVGFAACARAAPPAAEVRPVAAPAAAPADAAAPATSDELATLAQPNRPLTEGEIALLRPLFRDGIDYARVRVIDNALPLQPEHVYMTPRGHIYAPGVLWRADFSADPLMRPVFVHEMTHVWQFANGMDLVSQGLVELAKAGGNYERAYPYELVRDRDLIEYGMEQQASIVEDFFAITVDHARPRRLTNRDLAPADRDALYRSVLHNFLAQPGYARSLDPRAVAGRHAAAPAPAADPCADTGASHGEMCSWRFTPI